MRKKICLLLGEDHATEIIGNYREVHSNVFIKEVK